jgi:uncharacterized protein YecE (DUF72 family)
MIHEPEVLDELGQLYMAELEHLPIAELDRLLQRVASTEKAVGQYKVFLQSVMNHRFADRAQQLRQEAGKTTGSVRFEEDGYVVIADLPKRTEYDQKKLKEAVEALRKWGENPEEYVAIEIKVSETKYGAWPAAVRNLFEPARTLKTGKPIYKLELAKAQAANDSHFSGGK